jgi:hypothetical protein
MRLQEVHVMSTVASFVSRVVVHDAVRKGVAGALAGILVAVISESLWPNSKTA